MRGLSLIVLLAALILGVLAVIGVRGILQSRTTQVAGTAESPVDIGTVVVARHPLEFGTELTLEVLREAPWPNEARPEGAFSTVRELMGDERRVALRSISPNEPVLRDKISGYGGRAALSQIIEEGMRAVTIRVNDVSGAGGFVLPGDRVDVLHTASPSNKRLETITNILLQDTRVLAIDQIASESQEGAVVAKAATVEVVPFDAQKIALAAKVGELSLSLRNSSAGVEDDSKATKTARYRDLNPAKPVRPTVATGPSRFGSVRITRGLRRSTQSVVRERRKKERQSAVGSAQSSRAASADVTTHSKLTGAAPDLPPVTTATADPVVLAPQD